MSKIVQISCMWMPSCLHWGNFGLQLGELWRPGACLHDMKSVLYITKHVWLQFRHNLNRYTDSLPQFFVSPIAKLILASVQDLASYATEMFYHAMEAQRVARNYAKSAKRSLRQIESLKQAKVKKMLQMFLYCFVFWNMLRDKGIICLIIFPSLPGHRWPCQQQCSCRCLQSETECWRRPSRWHCPWCEECQVWEPGKVWKRRLPNRGLFMPHSDCASCSWRWWHLLGRSNNLGAWNFLWAPRYRTSRRWWWCR